MKTWQRIRKNSQLFERYFIREHVLSAIRRFFLDRKFHEVEPTYLTGSLPPESYLDVFETTLYSRTKKRHAVYLPTSPEPFLKKLLVAGIGDCFTLGKSFRNTEDMSRTHTPEFTILEWYRVGKDYTAIMDDVEDLIRFIQTYLVRSGEQKRESSSNSIIQYGGKSINIGLPWRRIRVRDAFRQFAGFDLASALTEASLKRIAEKKGYLIQKNDSWEKLFNQIFLNEVEPNISSEGPVILYEYPAIGGISGLAALHSEDRRFAERFEFYIAGFELGDAYTELTDWKEQLSRFHAEQALRKEYGKVLHPIDMDFIEALKTGMPESAGIAVGVDRLIMLFAGTDTLSDTQFFPIEDLL